jgi:flagellar biosynthesis GTPase FlhF
VAEAEETPAEEETTEDVAEAEEVAERTYESFEEEEERKKRARERALSSARTPEERVRAIVEHMPEFEKLESDDPKQVWVRFYSDNGCLDVLVKFRDPGVSLFGTQADSIERRMWPVYEAIHADRVAHEAVCVVSVEAYGDITDDYGQVTEEKLYETSLSRDVAARVNWSNAAAANYTELWRVEYIHPQLEAERVQGNAQQALDCLQEGGMFDFDWLECP